MQQLRPQTKRLTAVEIFKSILERTARLQVPLQGSLNALMCEPQQFPSGKGSAKSGFGDGNVAFEFKDGNSQAQLRPADGGDYDYKYVVMPMRI